MRAVVRPLCLAALLAGVPGASAFEGDEEALEADWRRQDGIGTARLPSSWAAAADGLLRRGDLLLADLAGADLGDGPAQWESLRAETRRLREAGAGDAAWEPLWRRLHRLLRRIVFSNPLAKVGPLLFVKQVPGSFSHQLTQVYGRYARPGGGLYVLDAPGTSLSVRKLELPGLGEGSFQTPDVSPDGRELLFAFASTDPARAEDRHYQLYRGPVEGGGARRLADGPHDDFSPRFLPDGGIVFVTTRRGGYHRCGSPGCPVYTLSRLEPDGTIRRLSAHEVQEWDPVVLPDGRILYTRWDYVDRHAVFGQHLWTCRPDGTRPEAYYGNYTRNPVGLWEARPVPGTTRVIATAGAHHAMTAGSIVLVDVGKARDGLEGLVRLTPQTPFPESEFPVGGKWFFRAADARPADSTENLRWPGHCYRTPWPLSEKYFLAAYSFDPLAGEPDANARNLFGLYLVDVFGNKELLHRDPDIASLWPVPLRPRPAAPALSSALRPGAGEEGAFLIRDVGAGLPSLPPGGIRRLRVVQVLPKTTSGKDNPPVGAASGAPGKAVLGTVPVESDGSAHFTAPSGIPLLFQALDERGLAVQGMRSATYLQRGETASCVGCHVSHTTAPAPGRGLAFGRPPSRIEPGPDGSRPFSYPILVQGVLDRHCTSCHSRAKAAGGVVLSGEPEGRYTASYNALVRRVPYAGDTDPHPWSVPGQFGARGSSVMKLLLDRGHEGVRLDAGEIERLATWMDANALFYGTFDPAEQAVQRGGGRIGAPRLQ